MRWLRHLFDLSSAKRRFPAATLDAIQQAIASSEHRHHGEIVFAVEGNLAFGDVLRGVTPRARAEEVFAHLRAWNTERNTGVLVYLLLADHAIEIVADRGVAREVDESEWTPICAQMQRHFLDGGYERGAIAGVEAVGELLARHFPADGDARNQDELPNRPTLL
jgi:uncharacterized membrane protein